MATYHVSSWQEIMSAICDSAQVAKEILLDSDIDLNDEYPEGVPSVALYCYKDVTLNLQGHTIKNLRTRISNPVPIIYNTSDSGIWSDTKFIIKNGDFVNLILAGAAFISIINYYNNTIVLENVRFVGYRTGNAYFIDGRDKYIEAASCYFDMPWYGAGSSTYAYTSLIKRGTPTANIPTANFCWFHESYGGWTITNQVSTSVATSPDRTYPILSCSMFAMSGCYIDGTMYVACHTPRNNTSDDRQVTFIIYREDIGNYYTASTPNVIDVQWKITAGAGLYYVVYVENMNAVFNKTLDTSSAGTANWNRRSVASQPNIILATPEQMQDISWLRAQGFPIIEDTPSE